MHTSICVHWTQSNISQENENGERKKEKLSFVQELRERRNLVTTNQTLGQGMKSNQVYEKTYKNWNPERKLQVNQV